MGAHSNGNPAPVIGIRIKRVFGVDRTYFISPRHEYLFEKLTGRKTLTETDMEILSELFDVEWAPIGQ